MGALRHLTDEVLRVLRVRPLHRPDHERRLTAPLLDPEDDLIEMLPLHVHHDGEQPLLALSGLKLQVCMPCHICLGRAPDLMCRIVTKRYKWRMS